MRHASKQLRLQSCTQCEAVYSFACSWRQHSLRIEACRAPKHNSLVQSLPVKADGIRCVVSDKMDAQKLKELEDRAGEAERRVTALEQRSASSNSCQYQSSSPYSIQFVSAACSLHVVLADAPAGTLEVLHAIKAQLAKAKEQQLKLEASEAVLKQQNQQLQKRNGELEKQNEKHEYRIQHLKHWAQVKPEDASQ